MAATAVLSLWAAFFATRADWATRRAMKSWDSATKPIPKLVFTGQVSPGQAIDLEVENLGGTLAAGGIIVHASDELYGGGGEVAQKTPARPISLPLILTAPERAPQPAVLALLVPRASPGGRGYCA